MQRIIEWDRKLSLAMAIPNLKFFNGSLDLRVLFLFMEWTAHGIPWLIGKFIYKF